ncbi:Uncharacterised protein [uncultured archaeon]|nr:Uncharacterised protein [uncultured archaeon]
MFETIIIIIAILIFSVAAFQDYKTSYVDDWLLLGLGILGLILNYFNLNAIQAIFYSVTGLIILALGFILNKLGQVGSGDIVAFLAIHLLIPFQPQIALIPNVFPFVLTVFINSMLFLTLGSTITYLVFITLNKKLIPEFNKAKFYIMLYIILDVFLLYFNQIKLTMLLLVVEIIMIFFKVFEKSINSIIIQTVNAKEVMDEDIVIVKKNGIEKKILATGKQKENLRGTVKNYYFLPRLVPYILIGLIYSVFFGDFILNILK